MIFENLRDDVRFGWRTLRKSPGFLVVSVLSLGVALGSVTTMFSVVDTVDLQDVPFAGAARLVSLRETFPQQSLYGPGCATYPSMAMIDQWRRQSTSFDGIEGLSYAGFVPAED